MISSSIEGLESDLGTHTSENAIVDNANTIAQHICLLHGMCCDHHCSLPLACTQYVPQLSSVLWVKSS